MITKVAGTKEISFLNVIREINLPDSIMKEFPHIRHDAMSEREKEIQLKIDKYFENKNVKVNIVIKSGQPTKSILKFSATNDIDLIIMGRKNARPGGGILTHRVARRAGCSLLIIPKDAKVRLKKILVPIDYSSHAKEAIKHTIQFATGDNEGMKIFAQKVYQVPTGYHTTGKSYTDFAKIMRENCEKEFKAFIHGIDPKGAVIEPIYTLDKHDDFIASIFKTARTKKVDAIVIGAKGLTSTTALFLGSKAEKLIAMDSKTPLVVIRPKGKQEGIIDYLRNI